MTPTDIAFLVAIGAFLWGGIWGIIAANFNHVRNTAFFGRKRKFCIALAFAGMCVGILVLGSAIVMHTTEECLKNHPPGYCNG